MADDREEVAEVVEPSSVSSAKEFPNLAELSPDRAYFL